MLILYPIVKSSVNRCADVSVFLHQNLQKYKIKCL